MSINSSTIQEKNHCNCGNRGHISIFIQLKKLKQDYSSHMSSISGFKKSKGLQSARIYFVGQSITSLFNLLTKNKGKEPQLLHKILL